MTILALLAACQDYNLNGSDDHADKYNPPDLTPEKQVDEITQVTVPAVDVLFVVDNSCSMEEEQRALHQNFDGFMEYFTGSGLDYHVGVVSTDMDTWSNPEAGLLIQDYSRSDRYIDTSYTAEEAVDSFEERASLGTMGSGDEKGKDAAWSVLVTDTNGENAGFQRPEADLSIVVISDERDYSDDVTTNEFANWMLGARPDGKVYFSSIVGPDPRGCATAERGTGYLEVTNLVGGILWEICEADWSPLLTELGMQAAGLKDEFFLSEVPVEETIEVVIIDPDGTEAPTTEWAYSRSRNSITLTEVPVPLSVVRITYEVLSSADIVIE